MIEQVAIKMGEVVGKVSSREKAKSVEALFGKIDFGKFSEGLFSEKGLIKDKLPPLDGKPIKPYNGKGIEAFKEKPIEPINKTMSPDWKGVSENSISNLETKSNDIEKVKCRNEDLAGKTHPETKVPYERKTVENNKGEKVEGVFPKFESEHDVQLPENLEQASDREQFKECNKQLKEAISENSELKDKFSEEQLEQIENGDTPDGYTWHHNEEKGKMQLVDSDVHSKSGHTGGKSIWGGGSENR